MQRQAWRLVVLFRWWPGMLHLRPPTCLTPIEHQRNIPAFGGWKGGAITLIIQPPPQRPQIWAPVCNGVDSQCALISGPEHKLHAPCQMRPGGQKLGR